MNFIDSIVAELTDTSSSLAGPLLKTKVLAKNIGNDELFNWANKELVGYRQEDEKILPNYRKAKCTVTCGLKQGYGQALNQPFPVLLVKDEYRDFFLNFELLDGVQLLEETASGKSGDMFGKDMGADMLSIINSQMMVEPAPVRIIQMSMRIHIGEAIQCLSVIRSKMLDFILEVQHAFPEMDDHIKGKIALKPDQREQIEKIIHQTIIHAGDQNTINTGNNNLFTN